ncbi:antirestriction protein ArdA [Dyadobacter sp. 32]|uniref:antirestriction protein ArdA n=1 Tax=Dyadobacter sp. 32 TaxID=538966 RepID=UPI0039C74E56
MVAYFAPEYPGYRHSLKRSGRPSDFAPKGPCPVTFSWSEAGDCPEHKAGVAPPGRETSRLSILKSLENAPRIYVGNYGMYNSGSLLGKWFDLTDYTDAKEFYQDCYEFHRNEFGPELMFQDWENIPGFLISECSLDDKAFDYLRAVDEMDDATAEAFKLYCEQISSWPGNPKSLDEQIESFQESYRGYFGGSMKDAKIEYAYQYVDEIGMFDDAPATLEWYFDYEAFARDLFLEGYTEVDGHVFADY